MKKLKLGEKVLLLVAAADEGHGYDYDTATSVLDFASLTYEHCVVTAQPVGVGQYYEVEMPNGVYGEYERCYLVSKSDLSRLQKTFDRISKAVK